MAENENKSGSSNTAIVAIVVLVVVLLLFWFFVLPKQEGSRVLERETRENQTPQFFEEDIEVEQMRPERNSSGSRPNLNLNINGDRSQNNGRRSQNSR